jgi:hypothetical protein
MLSPNKAKYDYLKSLVATSGDVVISTSDSNAGTPPGGGNAPISQPIPGIDPAPQINPNKIGNSGATLTPVYQKTKIDLRNSNKNQVLELVKQGKLIEIGDANKNPKYFAQGNSNLQSVLILDNKYYLEKKAGQQFLLWANEMKNSNIDFLVSSAVRFGSNTGAGPHGYGIAVDFSNLFQLVKGSKDPIINKNARIKYPIYTQIAQIGAKYEWYNPWRLSDSLVGKNAQGKPFIDELWHFEYWGPA